MITSIAILALAGLGMTASWLLGRIGRTNKP